MKKKSTKARNRQKWNFSYAQWGRWEKARALEEQDDEEIRLEIIRHHNHSNAERGLL